MPVANNPPANAAGLIPGMGRVSGEGTWQPTPVFLPGKLGRQRILAGYSPWGHKESDTTEHITRKLKIHLAVSYVTLAEVLGGK